jgi:hypothetical protein
MVHQSKRALGRAIAAALIAGAGLAAPSAFAWPVAAGGDAGDVTIENFTAKAANGDAFAIPRAEFDGVNLSKDEIVKMLTPDTAVADERALLQKLKADKIVIPAIDIAVKDGATIHLHDFAANHVDAGKAESLEILGLDASGTDKGGPVAIKSGALRAEGVDLAQALTALGASADAAPTGRLSHLTLTALDIVAPDQDSGPGKTIHLSLANLEIRGDYDGDTLKHGSTKLTGLVVEPSPDSEFGKTLAEIGYAKVEMSMVVGFDYQAGAKTFTLDELTLEGAQMGSVRMKANFGDVDPSLFGADSAARMAALFGCSVSSLQIDVVNSGLFEKALAYTAKQQGASADALKRQWSTAVGQMGPLLLGGGPSTLTVAAEAQKFLADPKSLSITVKAKGGALKAADFMAINDPSDLTGKLDFAAAANR